MCMSASDTLSHCTELALGMLSMLRGATIVDVVTGDWLAEVRSRKSLFQGLDLVTRL